MKIDNYTDNLKCPIEILGISTLLTPLADHTSSQRGTMFSNHLPQAQTLVKPEFPHVFTGYENIVGRYEYSTSERTQDVQILAIVPKFQPKTYGIKYNPKYTVICRGLDDGLLDYFEIEKDTMRSDGYGYTNQLLNVNELKIGNIIPKDMKFSTSPAHNGSKYMMGTNVNVAYMSIPECTEDAFVVSETAAKTKFATTVIKSVSFKIRPSQIPLNLYGNDDEYKFMPDIGDFINEDGILCAMRTPTEDSMVYDTNRANLSRLQYMHDECICVEPNAQIVDIDVYMNKKVKTKTPPEVFQQARKYREATNVYNMHVYNVYKKEGNGNITPAMNSKVTRCMCDSLADGVKLEGFNRKADITLYRKKEPIEFIFVTVKYKYQNTLKNGHKITNRMGGKGVVSAIWPDENMPINEYGVRADVIFDSTTSFNRMNLSANYEQTLNIGADLIHKRIFEGGMDLLEGFDLVVKYLSKINPNYGRLIETTYPTDEERYEFMDKDVRNDGIYINVVPFQKGIDSDFLLDLFKEFNIYKTPVTYKYTDRSGNLRTATTKTKIAIGKMYMMLLYKMPSLRSSGVAYINQHGTPMKPSSAARLNSHIVMVPIRFGEDENRNIVFSSGSQVAARMIGLHANSPAAVNMLTTTLLTAEHPTNIDHIDMTTEEIVKSNTVLSMTKHIFSQLGVEFKEVYQNDSDANAEMELPTDITEELSE